MFDLNVRSFSNCKDRMVVNSAAIKSTQAAAQEQEPQTAAVSMNFFFLVNRNVQCCAFIETVCAIRAIRAIYEIFLVWNNIVQYTGV